MQHSAKRAEEKKMTKKNVTPAEVLNEADLATIAALEPELKAQMIAAIDETIEAAADVPVTPAPQELSEIVAEIPETIRQQMLANINQEFDTRQAFEKAMRPGNDNIQKSLTGYRKKMALPGIAALMVATNLPASIINRELVEGNRFNVYAIDKINDILHGLNSGHFKNAINIAVMRSLFKFRKAGVSFTGLAAAAAASDKVIVDKQMNALLIRHTVSASTAPTQSSSTMNALQALGVVTNSGTAKHPIWNLTTNPIVAELEKKFA
jgi:hypothetical protein